MLSPKLLIQTNQPLINDIVQRAKGKHYEKIVFLISSFRQEVCLDQSNSYKVPMDFFQISDSRFHAIPALVEEVKKKLPDLSNKIHFDNYLTVDTFKKMEKGTTYQEALDLYNRYNTLDDLKKSIAQKEKEIPPQITEGIQKNLLF